MSDDVRAALLALPDWVLLMAHDYHIALCVGNRPNSLHDHTLSTVAMLEDYAKVATTPQTAALRAALAEEREV